MNLHFTLSPEMVLLHLASKEWIENVAGCFNLERKDTQANEVFEIFLWSRLKVIFFSSCVNVHLYCLILGECNLTKVKATGSYGAKGDPYSVTRTMKSRCLKTGALMCKLQMIKLILVFQCKYKSKPPENLSYHVETAIQCQIFAHNMVLWRL